MSDREELVSILANWHSSDPERWVSDMYEGAADAILAAGWRPPSRAFTDAEVGAALVAMGNVPFRSGDDWPAKMRASLQAAEEAGR